MSKIAIIYGSSSGTAEDIAKKIKQKLGNADLFNIYKLDLDKVKDYDFYILGTSTTGFGEVQEDWESALPKFAALDFSGKKAAIFGVGDSASYSDSFVGSMSVIYNELKDKLDFVGAVSTEGYDFDDSESVVDGQFVGLAIDEDNESDKSDERIDAWLETIKSDF